MVRSTWSGPCGLSRTRMAVTHTGGRPLEGESWWMVGPASGRSGATRNVRTSTNLYCRQQPPPMRRYLNDGATRTLAAPTIVDTRVDPTKLRISRESNMLASTLPSREAVKRRTSRLHVVRDDGFVCDEGARGPRMERGAHGLHRSCVAENRPRTCAVLRLRATIVAISSLAKCACVASLSQDIAAPPSVTQHSSKPKEYNQ